MPATRRMLLGAAAAALATPRRAVAQSELRFGALFPLSGPLALLGDEAFRGLEMAADERNAAGGVLGRPVKLIRADVTDPPQAGAEARRMAEAQDRPVALFGTLDTQLALAASQAAELLGMPYFELVSSGDAVTGRDFRMLFRSCARASELGRAAVELVPRLAALLGETSLRLAILAGDGPGPEAHAAMLEERILEAGLAPPERASYAAQPSEIAVAVRRLEAAGTQVLLHAGRGADAVALFRALADEGWRPGAVIGVGGSYVLAETAQAVGPGFDGTLVADLPQPQIEDRFAPGMAAFADAYRRRYGAEMRSGHSIACYSGGLLFFDALQRAGSTDPARLRAAILATDIPERGLPNGWGARFDERGQNLRATPVVYQWRDGRLLAVHPAEAAVAPLTLRRP